MGRVVLGILVFLSACSYDLVGPGEAPLEFSVRGMQHPESWLEQPIIQVSGESGQIVVNGKLAAADPCQRLTGERQGRGSGLTLRVTIERVGEACVAAIGHFEYDAVISDLAPGVYHLRVVHTYPGTGWPTITRDHSVRVQ